MAYDSSVDKLLKEKIILADTVRLAVFSYNGGEPKFAIQERSVWTDRQTGKETVSWKNLQGRINVIEMKIIAEETIKFLED